MTVVAPLFPMEARTRLARLSGVASALGVPICFWGWARNGYDGAITRIASTVLVRGGRYASRKSRCLYLVWIVRVFWAALTTKADTFYCLGLESALPIWAVGRLRNVTYIFDDADRLALVMNFPALIYRAIRYLEIKVSTASVVHIVPNLRRYDYVSTQFHEVKNFPSARDLEASKGVAVDSRFRRSTKLVVYANGWLGEIRGVMHIVKAARELAGTAVEFLLCGRVDPVALAEVKELPNVHYFGELPAPQALAFYRVADVCITLYDPKTRINRFAESNKWGDCVAMGVVPIVNDEVVCADFLREADACFSIPYHNEQALRELLMQLAIDKTTLENKRRNIVGLRNRYTYFDDSMTEVLRKAGFVEISKDRDGYTL
jgi:glycosyltransferase involved in cell wall biosynthesis